MEQGLRWEGIFPHKPSMRRFGDWAFPRRGWLAVALYLLVALTAVVVMARIVPPFAAPDEGSHLLRAASIVAGHIGGRRVDDGIQGEVDEGVVAFLRAYESHFTQPSPVPPAMAAAGAAVRWSHRDAVMPFPNTGQYGPFLYLPQAATLAVARALDLPVETSYRAARLAGALASILVAAAAIGLARWGRVLLMTLLLTPMFLFLAVSVSQDGLVIAVAALYAALLSRLWSDGVPAGVGTVLVALLCVLLLSLARPPYVLLALLLVDPRPGRFASLFRRLAMPLAAAGLAVLLCLSWMAWGHLFGVKVAVDPAVDASAQARLLLAQPWRVPLIALNSWRAAYISAAHVIGVLGWLRIGLAPWAYIVGWGCLCCAGLAALLRPTGPAPWPACLVWLVVLALTAALALAQYLTWTPVGAPAVEGLQGRYFMPLICAGGLALPPLRRQGFGRARRVLAGVACGGMGLVLIHGILVLRRTYLGV